MPIAPTPAQQIASRANGARSRGPVTEAGKARSTRNGTRHGLRGGPFALLPGEDQEEFAQLRAAVTSDWGPRDAYERRWVQELVASLWRQERLRGLELAALAAAEKRPPTEATRKRLRTLARYGARIDKDIGRALYALRTLRNRPNDWIDEPPECTSEPEGGATPTQNYTNELSPCTSEPEPALANENFTNELPARTSEPDAPPLPSAPEPAPNRRRRRRLEVLARQAQRGAA